MKDLSQRCIFSGSSENLNTFMEITLDGEKYKVAVSQEFEDDASPGAIKKLIPDRIASMEAAKAEMMSKFEEFKLIASEMGFDLVKKGEAASSPVPMSTQQITSDGFKRQKNKRSELSREEAIAAHEAAKRAEKPIKITHSAAGISAGAAPHVIPRQVEVKTPDGTKIIEKPKTLNETQQMVKGPGGVPIPIPKNIRGIDGETTITVVEDVNDRIIQMRGKQLHQMREQGDESYYSKSCRQCDGVGMIENRRGERKQCKNCGGYGILI